MTRQVDLYGPSSIAHTSPSFVATVGGLGSHVCSWARTAEYETRDWAATDTVRACWLKFGSDEPTQVVISSLAGPITTYDIQPRNVLTSPSLVDGDLVLTVPPESTLRIIIDGDRKNPLHVFAEPLSTEPAEELLVDWNDLALDVYSIDYAANEITFSDEHGLETGDRIIFQEDAGEPVTELTAIGLAQYRPYLVDVVSPNRVALRELGTEEGDDHVDLTDGATSLLLSAHKTSFDNPDAVLYFPPGVHVAGRTFAMADGCTFYAARGSVVIGGFEFRNRVDLAATGPGNISGQHATYEEINGLSWEERVDYAPIAGFDDLDGYAPNRIEGLTIFASPFWAVCGGVWSCRNVQIISGWTSNTDGIEVSPRSPSDRRSEVIDCFSWSGDDNVRVFSWGTHRTTGLFLVNSSGCNLHGHYWAVYDSLAHTVVVDDIDLINLTKPGTEVLVLGEGYGSNGFLIRSWMDGYSSNPNNGHYNVTANNVRVWEAVGCRWLSFENKAYPWGVGEPGSPDLSRDQYGQIAYWVLSNWTFEEVPHEISRIEGRDGVNTPHDIVFTAISMAGTLLNTGNRSTYIQIGGFPYNLTFDEVPMSTRRVILQIGSLELAGNRPASEILGAGGSTSAQPLMGIWTGGEWADLTPGVNTNPNVGNDRWGPEIGYRAALLPEFPSEKLWLIKYNVASTLFPIAGVNSWSPHLTGQTYSAFISWLNAAASAAADEGDTLSIDAIVISISASEMLQTAGVRAYGEMMRDFVNSLRTAIDAVPSCEVGTLRDDGGLTPIVIVEPHYEWASGSNALRGGVTMRRLALQRLEREELDRTQIYRTHLLDDDGTSVHFNAASLVIAGAEIPRLFYAPADSVELAAADEDNTDAVFSLLLGDTIMEGAASNATLPPQQVDAMTGCSIWVPERGQFETLQASVNNQVTTEPGDELHGPELGLAEYLRAEFGQIWLIKGAAHSYATRHHDTVEGSAPCFDSQVNDWHPASRLEYFDLYIRGHMRSAVSALRSIGRKPVLGPVFVSLGSMDITNPDSSHVDEIGLALEELAAAILEEAALLGVDTTASRVVFTLPATSLADIDGVTVDDVSRGREAIFALLDRHADYKAADLSGLTYTDGMHPDAAGNVTYARRLYLAWTSADTSRTQPLFVPTLVDLQKSLRLSQVPSTNDALAMIENAIAETRVEFYQVLGSTSVSVLRSYASTKTPESTEELLRKQAEVTEVKMVRLRLMRTLPMLFMDGSSQTQTWNDEAAFREMGDKLLAAEIRRLESEIQSSLSRLAAMDLTEGSVISGTNIEPENYLNPGDTVFVRTI